MSIVAKWLDGLTCHKKGAQPPILAYVYCDKTAVCIKIPLDMEVGLSPGDIVLDEAQLPLPP